MSKRRPRPPRLRKWTTAALQRLDDDSFFKLAATAFADRSRLVTGDIVIENKIQHGAPAEAMDLLFQEINRRGIDVSKLAQHVVAEAMAGRSFISQLVAPPSWKRYEMHAAQSLISLLKSEGVVLDEVVFDASMEDKTTGESRQVDLLLKRHSPRHHVVCEFREHVSSIPVKQIEAFITEVRDLGADKGVFVTSTGYDSGAVAKAKHHGVVLYVFREMTPEGLLKLFPERVSDIRAEGVSYWLLENLDGARWVFSGSLAERSRATTTHEHPRPTASDQ